MEQLIFDIQSQKSTLYNFTTEIPRSWKDLQYYSKSAGVSVPFYHKITIKKILSIPTNEFYKIKNNLSVDNFKNHVLPMAVRYITKDNLYVIERPPFQLEVDFRLGGAYSQNAKMPPVKIWVPWTVMVFYPNSLMNGDFGQIKLYFNSGPLDLSDQPLVTCFYPNTHNDSKICFSNSLNDFNNILDMSQVNEGNIGYIYNYVFNNYMMGGWNSDLCQNLFDNFSGVDKNLIDQNCPTIKLFLNPSLDPEFYKKLSLVFPKKYFGRIKKYYNNKFNLRTISREKYYYRNFGIFAAFTLEQTINFVKEIQYLLSFKSSVTIPTLTNIIKNFDSSNLHSSISSNTGINLVTKILSSSVEYDYLQCKVDLFVINDNESDPRDYHDREALLPLDVLYKINYKLINFLDTRKQDEQIAVIYDYSSKTFDVILNYDSREYMNNIIISAQNGINEYCKKNPSAGHFYALESWMQKLEERMAQYQQITVE